MPHNGFIYEARMDMMENSGHCFWDSKNVGSFGSVTASSMTNIHRKDRTGGDNGQGVRL